MYPYLYEVDFWTCHSDWLDLFKYAAYLLESIKKVLVFFLKKKITFSDFNGGGPIYCVMPKCHLRPGAISYL